MKTIKKYGFYFLLIGVVSDFLTPYVLGLFFASFNQMKDVMSLLGEVGSPVREPFLIWSVVAGTFYVLALPALYAIGRQVSKKMGLLLATTIGLYGIGDCIFTGLFSVDTEQAQWTFSTWVHNIGSGVGYAGFFVFPLVIFLWYRAQNDTKQSLIYLGLFVASIVVAGMYGLARVPELAKTLVFAQLGFWQRISFIFNYIPIVYFSIQQLKKRREKLV